ncbi:DUF3618 domain-containing protein [Paracoccus sp. 1_MG-2023]|uniref:DUF3618 domain-containing protein n=1 Tax=unclassified Paracoccus (in: a-proteobacteria) TaxID=2688777 RepID=UPI001C07F801|nr:MULTISPECIES: DUF3618 domain-containing protein [unclassified Paracoccus (in: a-proteobacteria)]MBU2958364.1 DUF3618 domain-containing protein [Paracoccus sp. C2R09]MDO6670283.1 DUF3618 domain-containing protein [Paracoccus sp. 1_MG-2023]
MNDQSSAEIQREIETERNEMNQTLSELTNRLSPDHLIREVSDHFRQHGGEITRSVSESVKQNPLALALTGVGLSWLIFGQNRSQQAAPQVTGYGSTGTRPAGSVPADATLTQRPAYPSWAQSSTITGRDTDEPGRLSRAKDGLASGKDKLSGHVDSAKDGIAAGRDKLAGHADAARDRASGLMDQGRDSLADARDRLAQGTEHLSNEARERVIAARERALAAHQSVTDHARRGGAEISNYYDQQPLIFGALAMAVGAALAGSLPRTRYEDEYLGQHSDQLIEEAERIFHEETEKTKAVYAAVKSEAADIAEETRDAVDEGTPGDHSAAKSARKYVEDTAERLADKAKDEADRQDLGKPS